MIKGIGALVLTAASLLNAQTLNTSSPAALAGAGEPLLGFALNSAGDHLYKVLGTGAHPRFGEPVPLPPGTNQVHLPPLQRFALLTGSDGSLAVLHLNRTDPMTEAAQPIRGAWTHPDSVIFSPTGLSVALYSAAKQRLQILTGLPDAPRVMRELATAAESVSAFAVTDDAELVVAEFENGSPYFSRQGNRWEPMATGIRPRAWQFLPRSRELAASDAFQNEIVLLADVTAAPVPARTLASNVLADHLAATADADEIMAASASTGAARWSWPVGGSPLPTATRSGRSAG